jgi:hypothetical protein
LTELGFPENTNSVPSLDLKLSANELAGKKKTVDEIVPAKKQYPFYLCNRRQMLLTAWWDDFYAALQEFPITTSSKFYP